MGGSLAVRLWIFTWLVLSAGFILAGIGSALFYEGEWAFAFLASLVAFFGSLPALLLLLMFLHYADRIVSRPSQKIYAILFSGFLTCLLYGAFAGFVDGYSNWTPALQTTGFCTLILYACFLIAFFTQYRNIREALSLNNPTPILLLENSYDDVEPTTFLLTESILNNDFSLTSNKTKQMETNQPNYAPQPEPASNKVLIKAAITGVLILVMLIPTIFITNLVKEREQRQKEVVAEVSEKWALPQTISTPYIVVPYYYAFINAQKKKDTAVKDIVLLPESLQVNGTMRPEERKRSIYTVLLYQAELQTSGHFNIKLPTDVVAENILWKDAKLCVGINDFKGINKQVTATFANTFYELTPGLPTTEIDKEGLSTPIAMSAADIGKPLNFKLDLNINGSQQLQFIPLAGNSNFNLTSIWASPSFDGATLPYSREVSDSGFVAQWSFNKARLPYGTFLQDVNIDKSAYSFGVSMVQPADQYAKTMRSAKYAILFIGLTFSLFFIVELMQKRPVHPVQYILVGLALVIFYTLLLSISEFVLFDTAYLIAASATVLLITLYAKGHFQSWKVAGVFAGVLGMLYGFIFVLIRLEDTSLLVGSIGLFVVLALVMYASRKINWYNPSFAGEPRTLNT